EIRLGQRQPRRAAVDDRAERGAVALAEGRDAEEAPEGVAAHTVIASAVRNATSAPVAHAASGRPSALVVGTRRHASAEVAPPTAPPSVPMTARSGKGANARARRAPPAPKSAANPRPGRSTRRTAPGGWNTGQVSAPRSAPTAAAMRKTYGRPSPM